RGLAPTCASTTSPAPRAWSSTSSPRPPTSGAPCTRPTATSSSGGCGTTSWGTRSEPLIHGLRGPGSWSGHSDPLQEISGRIDVPEFGGQGIEHGPLDRPPDEVLVLARIHPGVEEVGVGRGR